MMGSDFYSWNKNKKNNAQMSGLSSMYPWIKHCFKQDYKVCKARDVSLLHITATVRLWCEYLFCSESWFGTSAYTLLNQIWHQGTDSTKFPYLLIVREKSLCPTTKQT